MDNVGRYHKKGAWRKGVVTPGWGRGEGRFVKGCKGWYSGRRMSVLSCS